MTATTPFYRSSWTRWALIATGLYLSYALSPWGPPAWRDTPSLRWLHALLPWSLLAGLFVVYTLLLAWGRIKAVAVADVIGAVMYGWELVALIVNLHFNRPTNPLAISAVFLACVLHIAAARLAIIHAVRHDG